MHRYFFLIFEEFHSTIGPIRKHLEYLGGLMGDRFDIIMYSQNQKLSIFILVLPSFKKFSFCSFNVNY